MSNGQIPVITIEAANLPEAWEKACLAVWGRGVTVETAYDDAEEKPSLDSTTIIKVRNPLAEPMIHKNIPIGYEDLVVYVQEVVNSVHDYFMDDNMYSYMYSHRFRSYFGFDQISKLLMELINSPTGRRNQITTWDPRNDLGAEDPPCLQRVWFRLLRNDERQWVLNMNTHWRSRDLWKAWFTNAYAMVCLQVMIADTIRSNSNMAVVVGRYVDISDSLHIYGRDQDKEEIEKMLTTSYLGRSISSDDPKFQEEKRIAMDKLKKESTVKEIGKFMDTL